NVDIPGATGPTLALTNVSTDLNGYVFTLVANNAIGTATGSMTLTVNVPVFSTMTVTATSPGNGATDICSDTPLTVTFSDTVSLGSVGSIKIFNTADPDTPVDTINVASGLVQQRKFPGDNQSFSYQTIQITGNTVKIYPNFNVMSPSQTYYVTLDPKTFKDSGGTNFVGLTNTSAWQFTTKSGPADPANPVVNADGSADFLTVQGAVNSIPSGASPTQRVIQIRNGDYNEIVNISGKHNVTFRGQNRTATRVGFANNATFQAANGGTTHARMAFKINANDVALENLTVTNRTPQGGSQAEAIMISTAARTIVHNVDMFSRQDTILGNTRLSQVYFHDSTVIGNFDYIWGGGNLYFDSCTIRTISGSSSFNVTAARTETSASASATTPWVNPNGTTYSANGFSFVDCTFTADAGVSGITLAGANGTSGGLSSWAFCKFDTAAYVTPSLALSNNYVFWQHGNSNLAGASPISFANVQSIGGSPDDPRLLAATNVTTWFYGWTPTLAPNILTNPVGATVDTGDPVTLSVVATGIPDPTYQWLKNSTNLDGQTGSTLNIASAQVSDAGDYSVIVTTSAGAVPSATATVNVNPPVYDPPAINSFGVIGGQFSITFDGDAGATFGVSTSTNLIDWTTIFTTNAPALPFNWFDTNAPDPARFYRVFIN
ncbi:MAG TPA: pectinesterase family protein, partial [Verrucomicrobiota bacterium]|nr:pectinesterase family protein [Verrucomicrobiota bacterium]